MSNEGNNNFRPSDDFNADMTKLLSLLKSILLNNKVNQEEFKKIISEINADSENDKININAYFFTLMPIQSEDFDDLDEFDDDNEFESEDYEEVLKFEINSKDEDFLKKNGIKF